MAFRAVHHALLSVLRWTPTKNRKRVLALLLASTVFTALFGITAQAGQGPSQWCSDNAGYEEHIINSPATFNIELGGPIGPAGWSYIVCASPNAWGDGTPTPTGGAAWFGSTQGASGGETWVGCGSDNNASVLKFGCGNSANTNLSNPANPGINFGTGNWVNVAGTQPYVPSVGAGMDCASGTVAVSVYSCANGDWVGISGQGNSTGGVLTASGTGCANGGLVATSVASCATGGNQGIAISGTGPATTGYSGVSISVANTASSGWGGIAISGTGNAVGDRPLFAVSGLGDATGQLAVSPAHNANANGFIQNNPPLGAVAISGVGSSNALNIATSGTGPSSGNCLAISGTNSATASTSGDCDILWVPWVIDVRWSGISLSGTGPSSAGVAAISGTGNSASSLVAVSGAGNATGSQVAVSALGTASTGDGVTPASVLNVSGGTGANSVAGVDVIDNTGVAEAAITQAQAIDQTYVPPADATALKEALRAEIAPWVDLNLALGLTQTNSNLNITADCGTQRCPGPDYANPQPLDWQKTTYTCGPESTRLILWQMTGTVYSESQLANEEHTDSRNGTVIQSIAKVLNAHQNRDTFAVKQVDDASHYMSIVVSDVNYMNHSLINNVQTKPLTFWGDHKALHYDITYGYSSRNGGLIAIAEEWDPTRFGIPLSKYNGLNPYGYHGMEPLAKVYAAIKANRSLVVW